MNRYGNGDDEYADAAYDDENGTVYLTDFAVFPDGNPSPGDVFDAIAYLMAEDAAREAAAGDTDD